jgi:nitroreductase
MTYTKPISEIIQSRFSCRSYAKQPIPDTLRHVLREAAESTVVGPLGTSLRFCLVAAEHGDSNALRGLGAYGSVRSPAAFIVGATKRGDKSLEDFGYSAESLVLQATDLGLGTCWIGGFFTRSSFSRRIRAGKDEQIPAVISVGVIDDEKAARRGIVRRLSGGHKRLPWESLFFEGQFGIPLSKEAAGPVALALEAVRLGPSASNKQPWRALRVGRLWHFFLKRTPGYSPGLSKTLFGVEDLQRVDIGIAMCHFELTLQGLGLGGRWIVQPPQMNLPDSLTEYAVSFES